MSVEYAFFVLPKPATNPKSTCKSTNFDLNQFRPMDLFKRIDSIIAKKKTSRTQVALALGVSQSSFNRWFCPEQQDKLAPFLWKLADLWPDVPRNFLFFGEESEKLPEGQLGPEELRQLMEETQGLMFDLDARIKTLQELADNLHESYQAKAMKT